MKKTSFFGLLAEALTLSLSKPSLYLFSFCMALPFISEAYLLRQFIEASQKNTLADFFPSTHHLILLFLVLFFLFLFGKSNLIVSLDTLIQKKIPSPSKQSPFLYVSTFFRSLPLAFSIGFFFLFVTLLLTLPAFLFWTQTGTSSQALLSLGVITFLPILVVGFFVQEFAFFYILLSRLSLRSALENSMALFSRYTIPCLTFGFLLLFFTSAFTFSFNLVMLGIVALFQKIGFLMEEKPILFGASLIFMTWLYLLKQSFWLLFFREIATPPKTEDNDNKDVVIETPINEIPPA